MSHPYLNQPIESPIFRVPDGLDVFITVLWLMDLCSFHNLSQTSILVYYRPQFLPSNVFLVGVSISFTSSQLNERLNGEMKQKWDEQI